MKWFEHLFPIKSYSQKLAKKIKIGPACVFQYLTEKFGNSSFEKPITFSNIGCSINDFQELINLKIVVNHSLDKYIIDFNRLNVIFEEDIQNSIFDPKCENEEYKKTVTNWLAFLLKRGRKKTWDQFISETKELSEDDVIRSIKYSMQNGFTTLYTRDNKSFESSKGEKERARRNLAGDKTEKDSSRDYSGLTKRADQDL